MIKKKLDKALKRNLEKQISKVEEIKNKPEELIEKTE